MAEILKPVTPEVRINHLDLLANGERIMTTEKNKHLPIVISCLAVVVIIGTIIYYERLLKEQESD